MKTFKSDRAAKMAYTKAEKAWRAKEREGFIARDTYREAFQTVGSMDHAEYEALKATETMREIYNAATAQGFYVRSWHFGVNPTRDLIAANMD